MNTLVSNEIIILFTNPKLLIVGSGVKAYTSRRFLIRMYAALLVAKSCSVNPSYFNFTTLCSTQIPSKIVATLV